MEVSGTYVFNELCPFRFSFGLSFVCSGLGEFEIPSPFFFSEKRN